MTELTVSVEQAATMFGCSAETVRRQIRRGALPKVEGIGRRVRLSRETVQRAIAGQRVGSR
jgi:excisionase family DNA binding protein